MARCADLRKARGFVPLETLIAAIPQHTPLEQRDAVLIELARIFNGSFATRQAISAAARGGDECAAMLGAWMEAHGISTAPCIEISADYAANLERALSENTQEVLTTPGLTYPCSAGVHHWAFDTAWISDLLTRSKPRFEAFKNARRSDTAVLVGNGPSLAKSNLEVLVGQDVFVSNYAITHEKLAPIAKAVAVTNYFVAEQAPHLFATSTHWRVLPVWLSHVLSDTPKTIWLDARGGELFFAKDPLDQIAWHATVSYFWMQVLLHAGYRKLLLIGFDNSYIQPKHLREGDTIEQQGDDLNHFDPAYFRGKVWQAADTDHMAQTYAKAGAAFDDAGGEIVNCTVGGALEIFRRASLSAELDAAKL